MSNQRAVNQRAALTERLLMLAAKPEGFSIAEVLALGHSSRTVAKEIARIGFINVNQWRDSRYFATKVLADAYTASKAKPEVDAGVVIKRQRANWSADAPAIITEATKITIAKPMQDHYRTGTYTG